jgi:prophage regulatory protein
MCPVNTPPTLCPAERLIRWPGLLQIVPLSRSTILREIAAGRFPRPRRVTRRLVAWSEADIRAWLATSGAVEVRA